MRSRTDMKARGFSLVELLTVIAIIALVISIIIPVLSGARTTGKRLASQQLLSDIAGAAGRFKLDNQGRNPGYFSERQMGSSDNATRGMSGMENAMLDLAGQGAIIGSVFDTPLNASLGDIAVGPTNNTREQVVVRAPLMGTDKGSYFAPSREYYEAQIAGTQQISSVPGHAGANETDVQLLDVVDAFGSPVLFWSADTYTLPRVNSKDQFAQISSASTTALFYWNSNAAFLRSTALGRKGYDQTPAPQPGERASLLGPGASDQHRILTMSGLLGSVSAPRAPSGQAVDQLLASPSEASIENLFPGMGRGAFVLHSAGADGIYLSSKDKGFSTVAHEGNHIEYGLNFFANPSTRLTDDEGNPTTRDIIAEFDDIVIGGGG